MKRLDLGGTACYEDPNESVSVSLDGTSSDDTLTPIVVANYTQSPFPNNTFDEAFGCCALEGYPDELHDLAHELLRVMKPGGIVYLSSCGEIEPYHRTIFADHGFKLVEEPGIVTDPEANDYPYYDTGFRWQIPTGD